MSTLAGKSNYEVGTKIKITHVVGSEDIKLIGLTGTLTHPFGLYPANYVGVYLDKKGVFNNDICNLCRNDKFEIIEKW